MGDKKPVYDIYGDSSPYSEATEVRELDRVKSSSLEALKNMGVKFPIKTKKEFIDAITDDRPAACVYRGKEISLKELVESLMDSDFPIRSAASAATLLAAACPIRIESPESAPSSEY